MLTARITGPSHLLFAAIEEYKQGKYISAIDSLLRLSRSPTACFYLVKCYQVLGESTALLQAAKKIDTLGVNIPIISAQTVKETWFDSLMSSYAELIQLPSFATDGNVRDRMVKLEKFILEYGMLLVSFRDLPKKECRILSSALHLLGDAYILMGKLSPAADSFYLSNKIFQDSVYSRLNYADLAYRAGNVKLCFENLEHVNHLFFHRGSDIHVVYDLYSDSYVPINQIVYAQFIKLSSKCGFEYG